MQSAVRAKRKDKARANRVTAKPFTGLDEVVVVDMETTGLDPNNDCVVEVAAARGDLSVLLRGDTKSYFETFEARANPGMSIPKAASRIHGIHDKDVRDEEAFTEIAAQLREFIGIRTVIGHNSTFDTSFWRRASSPAWAVGCTGRTPAATSPADVRLTSNTWWLLRRHTTSGCAQRTLPRNASSRPTC